MDHDVIASTASTKRMSPQAVALAVLLHALAALALWWMARHPPQLPPTDVPIEVTIEQPPKPPPPPPVVEKPKPPPPPPPPAPPVKMGIPPPAEITADKPTQIPTRPDQPVEPLPPHPNTLEKDVPPPKDQTPPPPSTAFAAPEPREPPQPKQSLPPALKGTVPTPPAQKPASPPKAEPRHTPLTIAPQRPAPTASRETPSPSPFVNPADTYNRARVADNYLWQIVRKLAGYEYFAQVDVREGTTVVRVVIARNGRLLDVSVAGSSGYPQLDKGVVEGIRRGSPYAPLPDSIQGDSATFTLPLVSRTH